MQVLVGSPRQELGTLPPGDGHGGAEGRLRFGAARRGAGEQGPAPEPLELGLVHALATAPDAGQRVVQQAERLLGPSGQQLGLGEQPQPPGDQVLRATRLDVLQALAQQPRAAGRVAAERLRPRADATA